MEKRDYEREDRKREWPRHLYREYSLGRAVLGKNTYKSWWLLCDTTYKTAMTQFDDHYVKELE